MIIKLEEKGSREATGEFVLQCPYFDDHMHSAATQHEADEEIMRTCYEKAPDRKIGRSGAFDPEEFSRRYTVTCESSVPR